MSFGRLSLSEIKIKLNYWTFICGFVTYISPDKCLLLFNKKLTPLRVFWCLVTSQAAPNMFRSEAEGRGPLHVILHRIKNNSYLFILSFYYNLLLHNTYNFICSLCNISNLSRIFFIIFKRCNKIMVGVQYFIFVNQIFNVTRQNIHELDDVINSL